MRKFSFFYIAILVLAAAPNISLRAASLVDLGYGSSSQSGIVSQSVSADDASSISLAIDYESDSVVLMYESKARLADVLTVNLPVKITAYHNGQVDFDYPWYGFIDHDKEALESKVKAATAEALKDVPKGGWTDDDRENLARDISAAL